MQLFFVHRDGKAPPQPPPQKRSSWAVWVLGASKRSLLCNLNLCVSLLPNLRDPEGLSKPSHIQKWPWTPLHLHYSPGIRQTHYALDKPQLTDVTQHKQNTHCYNSTSIQTSIFSMKLKLLIWKLCVVTVTEKQKRAIQRGKLEEKVKPVQTNGDKI